MKKHMAFIMRHGPRLDAECVEQARRCPELRFGGRDIDTPLTKTHYRYIVSKMRPVVTKADKVRIIYASPFLRCVQTALVAARHLGCRTMVLDWRLGENTASMQAIGGPLVLNKARTVAALAPHIKKGMRCYVALADGGEPRLVRSVAGLRRAFSETPFVGTPRQARTAAKGWLRRGGGLVVSHAGLVHDLSGVSPGYANTFRV